MGAKYDFKIGDRVRCINASHNSTFVFGNIYTISALDSAKYVMLTYEHPDFWIPTYNFEPEKMRSKEPEQLELFPHHMSLLEEVEAEVKDNINHPDHYTVGKIEVFDFIKAWELSFAEGNVVKYVVRAPYKNRQVEDLKKARWYLDQLIKEAEER